MRLRTRSTGMRGDIARHHESLNALVAQSVGESDVEENLRSSRRTNDQRKGWAGIDSFEAAVKLAQTGDIQGARRLAPALLKGATAMMASTPRLDPVYSIETGRWIDVARYVHGEPECWGDLVEGDPAPRIGVSLIINTCADWRISGPSIDKLGIEIGGTVLGLQALGYAVSVYVAAKIRGNDGRIMLDSAPVNPGGSSLDVSKFAVILRPWFLRRIMFSLWERLDLATRENWGIGGGNYGRPLALTDQDAAMISGKTHAILVDIDSAVHYPAEVRAQVLRAIERTATRAGG